MKSVVGIGSLGFNKSFSTVMHIDLNSCFATIEQQANPLLRGKPIAVAAYATSSGCIIAPSIEAKKFGIKVGMRVKDGKLLCSDLIVLSPDPDKYRGVHLALRKILSDYTNDFFSKSIDEFVLNLEGYLFLPLKTVSYKSVAQYDKLSPIAISIPPVPSTFLSRPDAFRFINKPMCGIALEIKQRIKEEIGEYLTVSIGIAPNRFLAKVASNLNKPDGLDEINAKNFKNVYKSLRLTDLCGIKLANATRLNSVGIYTVEDFYNAKIWQLKAAFRSIVWYYWYLRLRGWEIDGVEFGRKSYGNSYALSKPLVTPEELSPILTKLVIKTSSRLRAAGYKARGVRVSLVYKDRSYWHRGVTFEKALFDSRDIYKKSFRILCASPYKKPVRELAVSCFNLLKLNNSQLELFEDIERKEKLVNAIDKINNSWGNFVITPARMLTAKDAVPDRIAFGQPAGTAYQESRSGGVREMEEFVLEPQRQYDNNW